MFMCSDEKSFICFADIRCLTSGAGKLNLYTTCDLFNSGTLSFVVGVETVSLFSRVLLS